MARPRTIETETIVDFLRLWQRDYTKPPSIRLIAARLGKSKTCIHLHLQAAEKLGLVARETRKARGFVVLDS